MINNEFYKDLGDQWYRSKGDAVALLRLEKAVTTPWVFHQIHRFHPDVSRIRVLDVGCGGGLLTNELAGAGMDCTGLDVSAEALEVGRRQPGGERVNWVVGSAERLPFASGGFDVVCLMDVLEHVDDPREALKEATRMLTPEGTLLFHTFNRTPLGWLFAAKGLDWFIKDSPTHIHDWKMFLRPQEIREWLGDFGFGQIQFQGIRPQLLSRAFVRFLATRQVPENFKFKLSRGLGVGYLGCARRIL